MMEMGIDRILFSVDYPFAENRPGTEWLKTLPLGPEDTEKLLNINARRLLKLGRRRMPAATSLPQCHPLLTAPGTAKNAAPGYAGFPMSFQ
jgi:Amidohydrolase